MKSWIILAIFSIILLLFDPSLAIAQSNAESSNHTAREEMEGKGIWEKLQSKQLECKNLTEHNFEILGEYFMGQSIDNTQRHEAMNKMMTSMMGEEGERQMHVTLGERYSSCDTAATYPQNGWGFMPMMWMREGGGNSMMGYDGWDHMMGWSFGILGWFSMLIFWILLILGVIALIRYLTRSESSRESTSSLNILKERYARGEINKKEFEEKKKDLL